MMLGRSIFKAGWAGLPLTCLMVCVAIGMVLSGPGKAATTVVPPGLTAASDPERYSPETLFEIINGDADLYLKAGFVALDYRRYLLQENDRQWLEMFVYRMERQRSAFAVFSVRRGREAVPGALTRFAYRYRQGLFFVHGPYYVEILAADETAPLADAMQRLATAFIDSHPVEASTIPELERFPKPDLIPGSMALHPAGAFGFDGFNDLFTARYRLEDSEATAFFRSCPSPEAAAQMVADYQAFLREYDGVVLPVNVPLPNRRLIRMSDTYTLIFTNGHTVAGVQDAATAELAERLARRLNANLSSGVRD